MALKSLVSRLGLLLAMAIRSLPTTATTHEVSASGDGMLSLSEALRYAQPGDTISLTDGIYDTALESYMDGEDGSPIIIEGSSDAIINGKNDDSRSVLIKHSFITLRVSLTYFQPSVQSRTRLSQRGEAPTSGIISISIQDYLTREILNGFLSTTGNV